MHDFTIRLAVYEDIEPIGDLWEKLARYHHQLDDDLPDAAEGGGVVYAARLLGRLEDTHTHVLVAEVEGVVVGYALGVIVDVIPEMFVQEKSGFIADIFVEEEYRRSGIGRTLVTEMVKWFNSHEIRYYEWYVAAQNEAGRAFWSGIGGRDIMIRMRVPLKPKSDS